VPFALCKLTVPVEVLLTPEAVETVPPVPIPVIVIVPVEALFAPVALAPDAPVTLPVIVIVPVEALFAPVALAPDAPVTLPVITSVPLKLFFAAYAKFPDPPVQLPVIVSVPVLVNMAAPVGCDEAWFVAEPTKFPTINPDAGEVAVNCTQFEFVDVDLLVTLAVSVTPSLRVKMPVPALDTSSQVVLTSIVTVCPVLARASSPTVGTTPPTHVAPDEKLPVAADTMRAMA
jgi:hypothetical protein